MGAGLRRGLTRRCARCGEGHLFDGWSPFPSGPAKVAERTRTRPLNTPEELGEATTYAKEYAAEVGRTEPLDVVFMPLSLTMIGHELTWEAKRILDEVHALVDVGMTTMSIMLPGDSRAAFKDQLARFSEEVLAHLPD